MNRETLFGMLAVAVSLSLYCGAIVMFITSSRPPGL